MAVSPYVKHYIVDGTKATPLSALPEEAWEVISGDDRPATEAQKYYDAVSMMRRCIDLRANGVVSVPWAIYRTGSDGDPVWESTDEEPPDELDWLADLPDLLWLTEATLCMYPQAFWSHDRNRAGTRRNVGWYAPQTITPKWDEVQGLTHFQRRIGNRTIDLDLDDVVYFWLRNPFHESKPRSAPVEAAAAAAGVILNVDEFAKLFFKRGAIKATLLTVQGNPSEPERQKLRRWWQRFYSGVQKAFAAEVVSADGVTPVVVGEGIKELSDNQLTTEKREDICNAMGVPQGLAMSNETGAKATAEQDDFHFYDKTIVPEVKLIARPINRQLLIPAGYRLQFDWQSMSVFQEDEEQRSMSFLHYVQGGLPKSVAAEILGIDLPEGMEYADLDEQQQGPEGTLPAQVVSSDRPALPANGSVTPALDAERQEELRRFRRWAQKRLPEVDADDFRSDLLTEADKQAELKRMGDASGEDSFFTLAYPT